MKKMTACCHVIGGFEYSALFLFGSAYSALILYYVFFLIIITNVHEWCSGWQRVWWSLGPGFDSQVPQMLISIFSHILVCRQREATHHKPHIRRAKCPSEADPKAKRGSTPYSWSASAPFNPESQRALCLMGLNSRIKHPFLAHTSLWFCYFSLSLYFSFLL